LRPSGSATTSKAKYLSNNTNDNNTTIVRALGEE
jgi:hypothetical protein